MVWSAVQGGRQGGAAFARKHVLSGATLEMLADMRGQFATMLADIGFVKAPPRGARAGARDSKGSQGNRRGAWVDDRKASWNQHAGKAAVVRRSSAALCLSFLHGVFPLCRQLGAQAQWFQTDCPFGMFRVRHATLDGWTWCQVIFLQASVQKFTQR